MSKQWVKLTLQVMMDSSKFIDVVEARDWCKENCRGRCAIKYGLPRMGGVFVKARFQYEEDAMAFKLMFV